MSRGIEQEGREQRMEIPAEYKKYFAGASPKVGPLRVQPLWFELWAPNEIKKCNHDYEVHKGAPGFLGFGSNGSGEMLAFDESGAVFSIPFIGMSPTEAWRVADSWQDFVKEME